MRLAFHGGDMEGDDAYQWALDGDAPVPLCHASRHARPGVAVGDGEAAAAHQMVGMHAWQHRSGDNFLVMDFFSSSQLWVCIVRCWSCIFSLSFHKFNDASPKYAVHLSDCAQQQNVYLFFK
jgi:hypothetical protein